MARRKGKKSLVLHDGASEYDINTHLISKKSSLFTRFPMPRYLWGSSRNLNFPWICLGCLLPPQVATSLQHLSPDFSPGQHLSLLGILLDFCSTGHCCQHPGCRPGLALGQALLSSFTKGNSVPSSHLWMGPDLRVSLTTGPCADCSRNWPFSLLLSHLPLALNTNLPSTENQAKPNEAQTRGMLVPRTWPYLHVHTSHHPVL